MFQNSLKRFIEVNDEKNTCTNYVANNYYSNSK